jgi:hypothetical protein
LCVGGEGDSRRRGGGIAAESMRYRCAHFPPPLLLLLLLLFPLHQRFSLPLLPLLPFLPLPTPPSLSWAASGFVVGSGVQGVTHGIWLHTGVRTVTTRDGVQVKVLFMDTEGFGAPGNVAADDYKVRLPGVRWWAWGAWCARGGSKASPVGSWVRGCV